MRNNTACSGRSDHETSRRKCRKDSLPKADNNSPHSELRSIHPKCHGRSCVRANPIPRSGPTSQNSKTMENRRMQTLKPLLWKQIANSCARGSRKLKYESYTTNIITPPCTRRTSGATERLLKRLGFRIVHRPVRTLLSTLFSNKDRVDHHDQSEVVHYIDFMRCDKEYIGEAGNAVVRPST